MTNDNQKTLIFKSIKAIAVGAMAFGFAGFIQADERGKQLYTNCIACHMPDGHGNQMLNAPAIAGLTQKYVANQLLKFHDGIRGGDVKDTTGLLMRPFGQVIQTEEDRQAIGAYIETMPSKKLPVTLEGGDAEKGKMLYMTCQACHGPDGKGNDLLNSPRLTHQHDWYLARQLHNFKDGIRGANPKDITGAQMRPMAMMLADEQAVKDVIAYLETLSN